MESFQIGPRTPYDQAVAWLEPLVGRMIMKYGGGVGVRTHGRVMGPLLRVELPTATSYHGCPVIVLGNRFEPGRELKIPLDRVAKLELRD
jgi:hypothetical protein